MKTYTREKLEELVAKKIEETLDNAKEWGTMSASTWSKALDIAVATQEFLEELNKE